MKKNFARTYYPPFLLFAFLLFINAKQICYAQNVTSPYSILGIGDIDTKDNGRYFASGSAALARRDINAYNFSNPASLTALPLKVMHFDIAMRGRFSKYYYPDTDTALGVPSQDYVVKRISLAFKVNQKTAIAVGLKPYTSVNYKYLQQQAILDGNTSYFKQIDGSGGINQFYFSIGKTIGKRFSAGFTASWLFGSLQRNTQYISSAVSLDITKNETDFYTAAMLQGGLQYYSINGKYWKHQVGLTASVATNLRGELTTEYYETSNSILKTIVEKNRTFRLPVSAGLGYSAVNNDRLILSAEANVYFWKYQSVSYPNSYTYPSLRASLGLEYSFKYDRTSIEKSYISAGFSMENSYIRIKNNNLWDKAFSFGAGKTLSRNLSLYTGIEIGSKGNKTLDQIREPYTQFIIGLTLKDIWSGSKFYKRYD